MRLPFPLLLAAVWLSLGSTWAWAREPFVYKPQLKTIAYRRVVPRAILRATKKVGPSRFFGIFHLGEKTYAIHFYDAGRPYLLQPGQY